MTVIFTDGTTPALSVRCQKAIASPSVRYVCPIVMLARAFIHGLYTNKITAQ